LFHCCFQFFYNSFFHWFTVASNSSPLLPATSAIRGGKNTPEVGGTRPAVAAPPALAVTSIQQQVYVRPTGPPAQEVAVPAAATQSAVPTSAADLKVLFISHAQALKFIFSKIAPYIFYFDSFYIAAVLYKYLHVHCTGAER